VAGFLLECMAGFVGIRNSWLARRLTAEGIDFTMADNAFARIADFSRAQELGTASRPTGSTPCSTATP
jgi:hypothetical protein